MPLKESGNDEIMRGRRNLRFTQQFARGRNSSNALAPSSESGRKGALVQTLNVELRRRRFTKMKVEHRSARHVQVTLRCATSAFIGQLKLVARRDKR